MIKKTLLLFSFLTLFNCVEDNLPENCVRPFSFSQQYYITSLRTVNRFAEVSGGLKGILIINVGLDRYIAYDKICPNNDCTSAMVYDENRPNILKCSCDGSEYGLGIGIGGAPQTDGFDCPAIEYNAVKLSEDNFLISSN
ncbi:phosphoribosylaminoimidazole carboxylase [Polaribacter sp. SA4-12]|uniref:phosphoribosylaminoimidazole carboxylase n=1 Tax=Polaribacter sp. SA4-12 TaxID=1312072 RepID=UPI000B3D4E5F|nr:phosphoribosylaminoimidazole carboxylase [Polaribacter sp. SA4-12]ARV16084.1 phosphoribosylaminoimidazole carboxylase [Polaribacter sp. SA4-12]